VSKNIDFSVVVVGGGFSGTMLAVQLLRRAPTLSVAVIDKGSVPGRGLAYSTEFDCHLLNVPAGNMSALPDEPDHFLRWARANYDPLTQSTSFLPRRVYGRYVGSLLDEAVARLGADHLRWIQGEASSFAREGSHIEAPHINVGLKDGSTLVAQSVVLAAGNFPPGNLKIPGLSEHSERYVPSAWSPNALRDIPRKGSVLLIGSGLTSVDVAIALKSEGFAGHIHILSRHGLIPQAHRHTGRWPLYWNDHSPRTSPRTTRGLVRSVRDQIRVASAAGCDWRPVIDALRPLTQRIWQSLSLKERRRFLRHVRPYWEVHRHRIAPEIGDALSGLLLDGKATVYAGRVTDYRESGGHVEVVLRERKTRSQHSLPVDRVINCTGPETDCNRIEDPLIKSLLAQGLARPDRLFLGLDVDAEGALIDSSGTPSDSIYAIGPARKGSLWETIAVPELREQASHLAEHLARQLRPQIEDENAHSERLRLPLESLRAARDPAKR
jgi:uncharacterized NAD(P)/FAD-binding protein YdhS